MAKLGEGDPRWIVSDRPDGTNINGWHWEETNKMQFCKEFFEAHCCRAQPYSEGESVDLFGEKFGVRSVRLSRGRVFDIDEKERKSSACSI